MYTEKSPFATCFAASLMRRIGWSKHYPAEIAQLSERIKCYESDVNVVQANTSADPDIFPAMSIAGVIYTDKKAAGTALIKTCSAMTSPNPVPLGEYRGFQTELSFDPYGKEYRFMFKGGLTHMVVLGSDIHGNITRLDNMLDNLESRLRTCTEQLAAVSEQMEAAKSEINVPFPREQELEQKRARLAELTIALKLKEKIPELTATVPDEGEPAPERKDKGRER
jgi:hypothetical protein